MAKSMKGHLKRLAAPRTWPLARKERAFIMRPAGCGAPAELSLPLVLLLKSLGFAKNTHEARQVVKHSEVLVNGVRAHRVDVSVPFMGTLAIPAIQAYYRLLINEKNTLVLNRIPGAEAGIHAVKVLRKNVLGKGRIQLGCLDGTTLFEKEDVKTGDTLLIEKGAIKQRLALAEGARVLLYKGKHVGIIVTIKGFAEHDVRVATDDGHEFETRTTYCFVLGSGKTELSM